MHQCIYYMYLPKHVNKYNIILLDKTIWNDNYLLSLHINLHDFKISYTPENKNLINYAANWFQYESRLKVDWTFELLWDPLLTISPNLFFWKQLTVRSLQSK